MYRIIKRQELPTNLVASENDHLLAQAMHVYQDRQHKGHAYAKTRGEVDITKKKIYKQKGTGGARHGARSAPIFVGGGVTHGPKGVKRQLVLPQAMKQKSLSLAITKRTEQGKVVALDGLSKISKTKEVSKSIEEIRKEIAKNKNASVLFVIPNTANIAARALRNIDKSLVLTQQVLNAHAVLTHSIIVFDSSLVLESKEKPLKTKKSVSKKTKKS